VHTIALASTTVVTAAAATGACVEHTTADGFIHAQMGISVKTVHIATTAPAAASC
jgi:hypothetical protein